MEWPNSSFHSRAGAGGVHVGVNCEITNSGKAHLWWHAVKLEMQKKINKYINYQNDIGIHISYSSILIFQISAFATCLPGWEQNWPSICLNFLVFLKRKRRSKYKAINCVCKRLAADRPSSLTVSVEACPFPQILDRTVPTEKTRSLLQRVTLKKCSDAFTPFSPSFKLWVANKVSSSKATSKPYLLIYFTTLHKPEINNSSRFKMIDLAKILLFCFMFSPCS